MVHVLTSMVTLMVLPILFAQHGWTPLFAAAWKGHKDVVKYLLDEQHCSTTVMDGVSLAEFRARLICLVFLKPGF